MKGHQEDPSELLLTYPLRIDFFIPFFIKFHIVLPAVLDTEIYCTFVPKIKKSMEGSPELPTESQEN